MNDFYVYAYLRSKDSKNGKSGTPYYIGKGKGDRAFASNHNVHLPKDKNNVVTLSAGMNEFDAFQAEMLLIFLHGRIDLGTGCLRNMTDGGEGNSGWKPSEETLLNMSAASKGRTISDEHRRKLSDAARGRTASDETRGKLRDAHKGRVISIETRRKMADALRGKKFSEERCQKMSEVRFGKKRGPMSEEQRHKLSEAHKNQIPWNRGEKGQIHSDETKRKMSESHNRYWANKKAA